MGNSVSRKKSTEDNIPYRYISTYNGKHASDVYKILANKYKKHQIFILSYSSTAELLDRINTILIYCDYESSIVKSVEIYY